MRKNFKSTVSLLLSIALLALASCVELTGQRITLRYDEARDEIQLLLAHDGIHESSHPPGDRDDGPQQIAEYIANGNVLFLDWIGHVQTKDLKSLGNDSGQPPALRALGAAAVASIRSTSVGHYRDPDGQIGALQLVVISRARQLIERINAAISEEVIKGPDGGKSSWPRTRERMREGAHQGKAWLAIEGNSLRFSFPAHPGEWAANKAAAVKGLVQGWQEAREGKGGDTRPDFFLQLLALTPFSIEESHEAVSIRLGNSKRPVPLRFAIRDVYNAKLESTITASVPTKLDEVLARRLLSATAEKVDPALEAELAWGPPEDAVRALLPLAGSKEAAKRDPAIARLRSLGQDWNRAGNLPVAPKLPGESTQFVDAWREWYRDVIMSPF